MNRCLERGRKQILKRDFEKSIVSSGIQMVVVCLGYGVKFETDFTGFGLARRHGRSQSDTLEGRQNRRFPLVHPTNRRPQR